jgi:hypothetical protein
MSKKVLWVQSSDCCTDYTKNLPITPVLCSSFKHLQPQLNNGIYIIGGCDKRKGVCNMSLKNSSKVAIFQGKKKIDIRPSVLACGHY